VRHLPSSELRFGCPIHSKILNYYCILQPFEVRIIYYKICSVFGEISWDLQFGDRVFSNCFCCGTIHSATSIWILMQVAEWAVPQYIWTPPNVLRNHLFRNLYTDAMQVAEWVVPQHIGRCPNILRNCPFRNLHTDPYRRCGIGGSEISQPTSLISNDVLPLLLLRRRCRRTTSTHTTTHKLATPPSSYLSSPTCFIVLCFFKIKDNMVI